MDDEPCIGYCDPTGVGKHPHPDWPADKLCDECFLVEWEGHIEQTVGEWLQLIGESDLKKILEQVL